VDAGKTAQIVKIAAYELTALEADLRQPVILFTKRSLTLAKAKLAYAAFGKYLTDYDSLSRIVTDKEFPKLPEEVRIGAQWLVDLVAELGEQQKAFDKAFKIAKAGTEAKPESIVKHAKLCMAEIRTQPKLLAKIAKRMIKGEEPEPSVMLLLPLLPLAILAWTLADKIELAQSKKPS
jgi:hypothetical protein